MSKAALIRGVMKTDADMTAAQIAERSGVNAKPVSVFLNQSGAKGEVVRGGAKGAYTYRLDPDYTRSRAEPTKRPKKRTAKKRGVDRQKLRQIADKAAAPRPAVRELAIESYRALGESLRDHIRNNVDDITADPVLCMLLAHHERAEKIVEATGISTP